MSIKRGCQCNFVAKQLLLDESLCTIHFHCMTHINKDGKPCHDIEVGGQRARLPGRLSTATKQWRADTLKSGKSPAQVIMPSDLCNIANKLAKELWEKHPHDAMSVRMWTDENLDCFYHYQEYGNLELNDPRTLA